MSSVVHNQFDRQDVAADLPHAARSARLGWRFWLPIVCISIALLTSHHATRFAIEAGGEQLVDMDETAQVASRSGLKQLGTLLFAAAGLVLLATRSDRSSSIFWPLLAGIGLLALYAMVSGIWSDSPGTTLRRAAVPPLMFVGALGTLRHWRALDVCRAVVLISTLFLCIGVLAELRYGTFLGGREYRFSGTLHPNRQALNCALLVLASLALYAKDRRWTWVILFCVGCGFLFLTRSRGGAISCMAAIGAMWWLGASGAKRVGVLFAGGAVLALLLMHFAFNTDSSSNWRAVTTMGRDARTADPTKLTGRVAIWQQVYADARRQRWLGYGYGAFWTSQRVQRYSHIHDNWAFSNAHSIYLETMANLGLVGVSLGLLVAGGATWRSFALFRRRRDPALLFILSVIALCGVNGLVEAICVSPGYEFVVMSLCMAAVVFYPTGDQEGSHERN